jgi:cation diffusion facilitator family transporter
MIKCAQTFGEPAFGALSIIPNEPLEKGAHMNPQSELAFHQEKLFRRGLYLEYFTVGWNVVEAAVAIAAGLSAGSNALIAFGADSLIEVTSASALLWRLRTAGPHADTEEHSRAERRALYIVAVTFFLLAAYVIYESIGELLARAAPETSKVGLVLAMLSLTIMPVLAYSKQKTGRELGSKALQADAVETWVCAYLSFALLFGVGLNLALGWWWADAAGALAMLPVILWQGWETMEEAREDE